MNKLPNNQMHCLAIKVDGVSCKVLTPEKTISSKVLTQICRSISDLKKGQLSN